MAQPKEHNRASKPDEVAKAAVESDVELSESELKDVNAGTGYKIDPAPLKTSG